IRPFLPESPAWEEKRAAGTLRRPSILELFRPAYLRTSIVTAILIACCYACAFGAIQMTPQIVPGLNPDLPKLAAFRRGYGAATAENSDPLDALKRDADTATEKFTRAKEANPDDPA